jgi:NAD(P)-dependent dehydrogenase (short-subunit alcohol dehydrogenase family)
MSTPPPLRPRSKLANVMFTYELARRLSSDPSAPTANALHPGVVRTELGRYLITDDSPFYMKVGRATNQVPRSYYTRGMPPNARPNTSWTNLTRRPRPRPFSPILPARSCGG